MKHLGYQKRPNQKPLGIIGTCSSASSWQFFHLYWTHCSPSFLPWFPLIPQEVSLLVSLNPPRKKWHWAFPRVMSHSVHEKQHSSLWHSTHVHQLEMFPPSKWTDCFKKKGFQKCFVEQSRFAAVRHFPGPKNQALCSLQQGFLNEPSALRAAKISSLHT